MRVFVCRNRVDSERVLYLFNAVGVDGGLRLQDADGLRLLAALWHLANLLRDEVMDPVQGLHGALDQAHALRRSCAKQAEKKRSERQIQPTVDLELGYSSMFGGCPCEKQFQSSF